jgi:hypothetical protein
MPGTDSALIRGMICRFHTADLVGNKIYFIGGFSVLGAEGEAEAQKALGSLCHVYDIKTQAWSTLQITSYVNFGDR